MAFCPKCREEYIDGIEVCEKCMTRLAEKAEIEKIGQEEIETAYKTYKGRNEILLVSSTSMVELAYIGSMLDSEGIKYIAVEKDIGQYLTIRQGRSYLGKSIYVAENDYDRASEIASSYSVEFIDEPEFKDSVGVTRDYQKAFSIFFWIWLVICLMLGMAPG